jgi:hypothetical protein
MRTLSNWFIDRLVPKPEMVVCPGGTRLWVDPSESGVGSEIVIAGDHERHLIKALAAGAGVPVVLNTSFNENEPIACRRRAADDCLGRTGIIVLAIGSCLICKSSALHQGQEPQVNGHH